MTPLPFKVEWSPTFPVAKKARKRLHPIFTQTEAYGRIIRAGEILLILPSCILIALVVVQAIAGNSSRSGQIAKTTQVAKAAEPAPSLVTVATSTRSPLLNISAQRP